MKISFSILLLLFGFTCFGNKSYQNLVSKVDSLKIESLDKRLKINQLKDSIYLLSKDLSIIKERLIGFEDFKGESRGNDSATWEYGSSIVGILTGVIILFGVVYYFSSKQAAKDAFDDSFDIYTTMINKKVEKANALLDVLGSRVDMLDESENKLEESSKNIEDEFSSGS